MLFCNHMIHSIDSCNFFFSCCVLNKITWKLALWFLCVHVLANTPPRQVSLYGHCQTGSFTRVFSSFICNFCQSVMCTWRAAATNVNPTMWPIIVSGVGWRCTPTVLGAESSEAELQEIRVNETLIETPGKFFLVQVDVCYCSAAFWPADCRRSDTLLKVASSSVLQVCIHFYFFSAGVSWVHVSCARQYTPDIKHVTGWCRWTWCVPSSQCWNPWRCPQTPHRPWTVDKKSKKKRFIFPLVSFYFATVASPHRCLSSGCQSLSPSRCHGRRYQGPTHPRPPPESSHPSVGWCCASGDPRQETPAHPEQGHSSPPGI